MKEQAKNALTHDIELFGKTVSTVAIAALFLIGAGSAAVLTQYGQVGGTANVDQAVTMDDDSKTDAAVAQKTYNFDGSQTAGETFVETHTLESHADVSAEYGFETTCDVSSGSNTQSSTDEEVDWATEQSDADCAGIDTSYVEYFDNAGHDFDGYDVPSAVHTVDDDNSEGDDTDGDESFHTIEAAVNAVDDTDGDVETVVVKEGSYTTWIPIKKSVHLVSENPQGAKVGRLTLEASDVTVQGFELVSDGEDYNAISLEVKDGAKSGIVIKDNHIHGVNDERGDNQKEAYGILAWSGGSDELQDVTITNNLIENVGASSTNTQGFGIFIEDLASGSNGLQVSHNTIRDINDATISGDDHPSVGVAVLPELTNPDADTSDSNVVTNNANADVESNVFASNDVDVSVAGDASQFSATSNQFGDGIDVLAEGNQPNTGNIGLENIDGSTESVISGTVDASDNWFGTDGISTQGSVDASWETKSDLTLQAGETDKFGVVNEFAINLKPEDYTLETHVRPPSQLP